MRELSRVDAGAVALLVLGLGAGTAFGGPPASVWKGVYTEAQSKRGKAEYDALCAQCHGPTLDGGQNVPELAGDNFLANWDGLSAEDLFSRIKTTMPANKPGTLRDSAVLDVMAYLFQVNQFPPGNTELPLNPEALKQIEISKEAP